MPWQPMRPPEKHVSQERMREILSRRSGKTQSPQEKSDPTAWPAASGETRAPKAPPRAVGKLQWQKPEAGSLGVRTVCEWYSCCKVMLDGEWKYEVWTRAPLTGGMRQLAIGLPSFEEGRKVAQADADSHSNSGLQP
jgi:hypothetical protein